MEKELLDLDKIQELEEVYRKKFTETLNPCFLVIAASYQEIIQAKKYNLKYREKEDELSL